MLDPGRPIPILSHGSLRDIVAYRGGYALSAQRFQEDAGRLAAALPERSHVVNLCKDRYYFAVGLAAALVRKQVSLLPPSTAPAMLRNLALDFPGLYALSDGPVDGVDLETMSVCAQRSERCAALCDIPAEQVAVVAFTSGSTGRPSPHPKTWGEVAASAGNEASELGLQANAPLTLVATVPPQHMYGLESSVLIALRNGFALHAGRPFFPADVAAALAQVPEERILVTTPVHLRALLDAQTALPALRLILCATAPLSPAVASAAEARFQAPLWEIYGFTEAGVVASRRTVHGIEWHTLPDVQVRRDARGVWFSGGHIPHEALAMDVLELRGPGRFVLHGRSADLVNIAGKRTSLAYLTHQLASIPGVRDAVFIMPEETNRRPVTRLMAFAVAPGRTRDELMEALRVRIDAAFLPRPLVLVDALPRDATGKLPREALLRLGGGSPPREAR